MNIIQLYGNLYTIQLYKVRFESKTGVQLQSKMRGSQQRKACSTVVCGTYGGMKESNWVLSEKDGFGHTQRRHFRPFLLHAEIRSHRNPKNGFLFVKTGSLSKNLARMGSFCKFLRRWPAAAPLDRCSEARSHRERA